MFRKYAALAAGVAALALSACASAPANQTPAQILAAVHADVANACQIAGPMLDSMKSEEPGLTPDQAKIFDKVYSDTKDFCSVHDTVSIASVKDFANSAIPATLKIVNASSLKQSDKSLAAIMLIGLQAALNTALLPTMPAVPASSPSA